MASSLFAKQCTIKRQKQVLVAGILLNIFHATATVYSVTIDLAN